MLLIENLMMHYQCPQNQIRINNKIYFIEPHRNVRFFHFKNGIFNLIILAIERF